MGGSVVCSLGAPLGDINNSICSHPLHCTALTSTIWSVNKWLLVTTHLLSSPYTWLQPSLQARTIKQIFFGGGADLSRFLVHFLPSGGFRLMSHPRTVCFSVNSTLTYYSSTSPNLPGYSLTHPSAEKGHKAEEGEEPYLPPLPPLLQPAAIIGDCCSR